MKKTFKKIAAAVMAAATLAVGSDGFEQVLSCINLFERIVE